MFGWLVGFLFVCLFVCLFLFLFWGCCFCFFLLLFLFVCLFLRGIASSRLNTGNSLVWSELTSSAVVVNPIHVMLTRDNRSRFSGQIVGNLDPSRPEKSTTNNSVIFQSITSGTQLKENAPTSVSLSSVNREYTRKATLDEEKELSDILASSDTQPVTSPGAYGDTIINCLKRNGTLHFQIRTFASVPIWYQVHNRYIGSKQTQFCVIRWTFVGNVGTLSQVLMKNCKKREDSASVYELNSTLAHKPQIKQLFRICEASPVNHHLGETNEILVFIKTKDVDPFMRFYMEVNTRSSESLKIHFSSVKKGINVSLAILPEPSDLEMRIGKRRENGC